jgi:hypothetical protein
MCKEKGAVLVNGLVSPSSLPFWKTAIFGRSFFKTYHFYFADFGEYDKLGKETSLLEL